MNGGNLIFTEVLLWSFVRKAATKAILASILLIKESVPCLLQNRVYDVSANVSAATFNNFYYSIINKADCQICCRSLLPCLRLSWYKFKASVFIILGLVYVLRVAVVLSSLYVVFMQKPRCRYPTVMDELIVEDPVVMNTLIDQVCWCMLVHRAHTHLLCSKSCVIVILA